MILNYIKRVLIPYKISRRLENLFLLFDSAPCHKTSKVKDFCQNNQIEILFIPPRLTNLLQPADVMWFHSLKASYHFKWNEWFLNGEKVKKFL